MTPLTIEEIYNDLNPDWWITDLISPPGGLSNQQQAPSTMLYFTVPAGTYASFASQGNVDALRSALDVSSYVETILMWEAAGALYNADCTGNITNVQPSAYQVFPIYFK